MLVPDSEIRDDLIAQTADLRYSVKSQGLRDLLSERGHSAMRCVQLACDQGDDVSIDLILEDGSAVRLNYREHYRTRQAIRIVEWEVLNQVDREIQMARRLVSKGDASFDDDVRRYFEQQLAETDSPPPSLEWGDRTWHAFESPPD